MLRANVTLLTLACALTLPLDVWPNEAKKPETKAAPVKEKFYVYGGGCSRSIGLQGSYDSIAEAYAAAEKFRTKDKLRFVTVRTGAHAQDYFGYGIKGKTQYKVYRNSCRIGWQLTSTFDSADKAKELADTLTKGGAPAEIVLHYPAAEKK